MITGHSSSASSQQGLTAESDFDAVSLDQLDSAEVFLAELGNMSEEEGAMVVARAASTAVAARAASAAVAARAASVTGVLGSTATAGARKAETPPRKRRFSVRPELLGNPNVQSPTRRRPGAAGHSHWTARVDEVALGLAHHDRGPCPLPVAWLKTREDALDYKIRPSL